MTVSEASEALGTSPQTIRSLLRTGELNGEKRAWGSRFVWEVSEESVEAFLATHGRLNGSRRGRALNTRAGETTTPQPALESRPKVPDVRAESAQEISPAPIPFRSEPDPGRPWYLRPRGRATIVVLVLGIPAIAAYVYARILPTALWFDELGYGGVLSANLSSRVWLHLIVTVVVWSQITVHLVLARPRSAQPLDQRRFVILVGLALLVSERFASLADSRWELVQLWRHRQSFGQTDPVHGKDIGYFVFVLPFQVQVSHALMLVLLLAAAFVAASYSMTGRLSMRPFRATQAVRTHGALMLACLLVVIAWRLHLARYELELGNGSASTTSVPGAGYVDLNVRSPLLNAMTVIAFTLAVVSLLSPIITLDRLSQTARTASLSVGIALVACLALVGTLAPPLVQHYVVDPNPLLSEQQSVERSIKATRAGLGLDRVNASTYAPDKTFDATDFAQARDRLTRVATWDIPLLEARMRELTSDVPYFRPDNPSLSIETKGKTTRANVVGVRELSPRPSDEQSSWVNDRLAYTHGLGLMRYSATAVDQNRNPILLDNGQGPKQPRVYFGNLPGDDSETPSSAHRSQPLLAPVLDGDVRNSSWVLANSRRPEVDAQAGGTADAKYHYDGSGGIALSNPVRKAVFALALDSRQLWFSEDVTSKTRLMLHRDVHDRLTTLAGFISWDSAATPLTTKKGLLYVVHGYTTTSNYPYADRFRLGDAKVTYARSSVLATVDAFSGAVKLYVTDSADPILRAWRATYPDLFLKASSMPADIRGRLPYPTDLFNAQATAYERYHVTRPDVFVANSDEWARPISLSGPIDVAGDVDFDESDEDDLRRTLSAGDIVSIPPGMDRLALVRQTYFTPRGGQNLVGTLSAWVGDDGRLSLAAEHLRRNPLTLGPAQVSRLVFATPRVRNLLGLRNLEIRDLDKSSLDSVILGRPRVLLLQGGPVQIQALYEGSRGAGAARLLGVTAFVNGHAGLGANIESALRQALNRPPALTVHRPAGTIRKDQQIQLRFDVANAHHEFVTISSTSGAVKRTLRIHDGQGRVQFTPHTSGTIRFSVRVVGLDGTSTTQSITFSVLDEPPVLRIRRVPDEGTVGSPVNVRFGVANALSVRAQISNRAGIVFSRLYELKNGTGLVQWTPEISGKATLRLTAFGRQHQEVSKRVAILVRANDSAVPPRISFVRVPETSSTGQAATLEFNARGCTSATVIISGEGGESRTWTFSCPATPGRVAWTPTRPGTFTITLRARNAGTTSQVSTEVVVRDST